MKKNIILLFLCSTLFLSAQSEIYDQINEFEGFHLISHMIVLPVDESEDPMILIMLKGQKDIDSEIAEWDFYFNIVAISNTQYITPKNIKFSIDKKILEAKLFDPDIDLVEKFEKEGYFSTVVIYDTNFEDLQKMANSQTRMLFDHDQMAYYKIIDFDEDANKRLNEFVDYMNQTYDLTK